jgi:thiol-disulfide isomerase/thioredoxin
MCALRMRSVVAVAFASACMVLACSSASKPGFSPPADDGGGDDGSAPSSSSSGGGGGTAGYPPGPYGSSVGFTLNDFSASGYRLGPGQTDSTKLPWTTIDVSEYHESPVCKCLLITVGATWCGDCMAEQPMLVQSHAQDPSFCVMGILQADIGPSGMQENATKADVDAWTQMYKQNFYVVQGSDETMYKLLDGQGYSTGNSGSVALPFSLIVKPSTMKVVGQIAGVNLNAHDYAMGLCGQ